MRKPKILIIGTTDNRGGAAQVSWKLSQGLIQRGFWVKHIVGYKNSNSKDVYQLKTPLGKTFCLISRHFKSYVLANDQDFGLDNQIFNHPWYKQADIVHLQNTHGNYISLKAIEKISQEKKLVWTVHDMWPITSHCSYTTNAHKKSHNPLDCPLHSYPPILWNNKKNLWHKKISILKDLNITYIPSSKWLENKIKQTPLNNKKITQIYNGVDTKIFTNSNKKTARKKSNLPQDKKIALFVAVGGKANKRKGYEHLENLAKNFKNCLYLVVGGQTKYRKNNILFLPKTSNQDQLANYYNASDIFVFTSIADNNPQVVLESLSCHLPVLGFDACGTTELINHQKNGYLAKFQNHKDLIAGFKFILNHKFNHRSFSADYSIQKMVSSYEKLFNSV